MNHKENPTYLDLFLHFFWIGLTGFGGLAMTAHIRKHIVDKRAWLDAHTFDSGLALCQIIPGAIVMQLAAYIGLKIKGIRAAVVCFIGFGLPAFLVMLILSVLYKETKNISMVDTILQGLRVVIVAIVANAAYVFGRKNFKTTNDWIIGIVAAALFLTKLNPVIVLAFSGVMGLFLTNKTNKTPTKRVLTKTFPFFLGLLAFVFVCAGLLYFFKRDYFTLAMIMLRIDLFSFGGGLAAMPVMYHELVDVYGWFDSKTFMDGVILGQITPGSIIIAATFYGYLHFGYLGSFLATICVFTPSFLILMGIIPFFDKLRAYPQFNKVINGVLCSFVGLLSVITVRFGIDIHWTTFNILFATTAFILLIKKVDVVWIIAAGIVITILF